ncbi:hypothetical protein [Streptomyces sp. NBC_01190]|uniref:hypothetical protein n=1 Tax=Streptomyces sp. NBC_01190 TaxID=2903767 RepID=UPI00386D9470|nr:hypothetical protein OG519_26120 [Streptomyces sp. NBC_01190]
MIREVARLSRRGVVAVAAVWGAGAVSGCSGGDGEAGKAPARPAPGAAERAQAARDSAVLLARYDGALAAHPALAGRLAPLRAEVAEHVGAFGGKAAPPPRLGPPTGPTGPPTGRAVAPATGTPTGHTPPAATPAPSPAQTLAALAAAERELADRRASALLTVPGELARLLASVAAAGAGHVVLLGGGSSGETA